MRDKFIPVTPSATHIPHGHRQNMLYYMRYRTAIHVLSLFLFFFLILFSFYVAYLSQILRVIVASNHIQRNTYIRYESSGRAISQSQRPLPDNAKQSQETRHPCHRRDLNSKSQQASGHRPTPWTDRPPESFIYMEGNNLVGLNVM